MSVGHLKQALSGRWQLPLLVVAIMVLVSGIGQLSPDRVTIPFDEALDRVGSLRRAEQFGLARDALDLLDRQADRLPDERVRIMRVRAETRYFEQRAARAPSGKVAREIVTGYLESEKGGIPLTPLDRQYLGEAYEWMGWPTQAIREYRQALEGELPRPLAIRRRIIAQLRLDPEVPPEVLHGALDSMIEATNRRSADMALWAAEQKIDLWAESDEHDKSLVLLERLRPQFVNTKAREGADYLEALTLYRLKRYDDAERLLRSLRDRPNLPDLIDAKSGWLLGELNLRDGRPQLAMAFYRDVVRSYRRGEYRAASLLGEATALAELERYDQSLKAFEGVITEVRRYAHSRVINPLRVRTALTTLGEKIRPDESQLETALQFAQLARSMVDPDDTVLMRTYAGPMATLYAGLARSKRKLARRRLGPEEEQERLRLSRESRRYFAAAGDEYRRLAQLLVLDEKSSAAAAWEAVEMYDQAGMAARHISALKAFIVGRPNHERIPEARYRLGRAYHVLGQYKLAIEQYKRNQRDHPRSGSGIRSLVELGSAYMALGPSSFAEAEEILLRLIEPAASPRAASRGSPREVATLVTPMAQEFRNALFLLAELYEREGEYEKAIARLESALTRYPDDARATRARYLLADAYRRSTHALREESPRAASPGSVAVLARLEAERRRRLELAAGLYGQVITAYDNAIPGALTPLQKTYLRLSYLYRADCVFDLGQYQRARNFYEEATLKYENDPAALAGYLRITSCHQRLGNLAEARRAIRRARIMVRKIPREKFNDFEALLSRGGGDPAGEGAMAIGRTREQWEAYLQWLGRSTLFADIGE